ncbi:MAG: GNAT family N-acetyltransferase, partial [Shewanella sp.]
MTDFQYVPAASHEELVQAAQLIDSRDDNAHPLDHSVFFKSRAVVLAKNASGEIIGCAAIKAGEGPIGELGYLVVSPQYRRLGIGRALTLKRLDVAASLGIVLLFATVRLENVSSRANLLKLG